MTLSYIFQLYLKARIMSWLTHGYQSVYLTTTLPEGVVHTNIATFLNGRLVVHARQQKPASLFPDTVPEEWVPRPPEDNPDNLN